MINGKSIAELAACGENCIPFDAVMYELRQFGLSNEDIAEILEKAAKVLKDDRNV